MVLKFFNKWSEVGPYSDSICILCLTEDDYSRYSNGIQKISFVEGFHSIFCILCKDRTEMEGIRSFHTTQRVKDGTMKFAKSNGCPGDVWNWVAQFWLGKSRPVLIKVVNLHYRDKDPLNIANSLICNVLLENSHKQINSYSTDGICWFKTKGLNE